MVFEPKWWFGGAIFFVLSGFLISYLLFQEHRNTQTISIKQFYWRRILRIWPLYYLIAIIGLYLLPYVVLPLMKEHFVAEYDLLTGSVLFLFFLPNLANSWYETRHLHSLWSIGVEEQFYLFWAPLVKYLKRYFVAICLIIILLKITVFYYFYWQNPTDWLTLFISSLQFECMAIGGLGAYWLFHGGRVEGNFWFSRGIQAIVLLLLTGLIFANLELNTSETWWGKIWQLLFHSPIYNVLSNVLFVYTIINIAKNPLRLLNTDHKAFDFLGGISYGLYMYHPLVVHFVIKVFAKKLLFLPSYAFLLAMYCLTMLVLVGVSYCSFRFFEKPIITRWKKK